ncbi:hypothetical protein TSUD_73980 [Trifolium subterraneum]|uniref:CCHC-type domain-containing protein n=1 Tax=Trifolium subterraneum TaxID=3900 RepID=A0A2Z6LVD2_TRISU|nr:hypothetical protein TSUD_73980 [Trifolium subterraneum]
MLLGETKKEISQLKTDKEVKSEEEEEEEEEDKGVEKAKKKGGGGKGEKEDKAKKEDKKKGGGGKGKEEKDKAKKECEEEGGKGQSSGYLNDLKKLKKVEELRPDLDGGFYWFYNSDCAMLSQMLEHLSFRCSSSQRLYLLDALPDVLYNVVTLFCVDSYQLVRKSNLHANLPILDGKNWDTWVKQMKVIFIVQEADEQVNTILDPLPANATEQQRTTFREAQKKDSKALFLIHQCVDSKVFEKIADATTSKDAWDILQKRYGGDAKMKNCGSTLSEEEMVENVLRTLTHKFDHIVVTIEQTKDLSEIKMEDLQSTLEAHELKHGERNHGKEDEQALFVKFKKYQDEKKKWQNKKGSKKGKESVEEKPESSEKEGGGQNTKKDKSTIQCYSCNKYGHYASECKAPKKKKSQNTEAEANVAEDDVSFMVTVTDEEESEAHMTENDNGSDQGPLLMMPTTEDEFGKQEGWYLDTCCSNHMTSNKEWLVNYDSSKKSTIRFADSRTVKSEGIGDMLIKGKDGNQVLITGVMYVPDVPSNILSIEQLVEKAHISEDVIMNEVHINEDSESDCNAETEVEADVEAPEAEVSAVEANVETRAGSTKARESDVEADAEASEAEVSAVEANTEARARSTVVEANVETRARSTRTKDWNVETKVEASKVEANVETEVISTRKSQVPARWQECELADDSRVGKEGELMQCALLVDEPVTKSKAMTDVGIVSCFLRNKLFRTRGLMLHQKKYAGEILRRFNIVESKSAMEMNLKLGNQSKEANCRIKVKNHGEDPTIIKKVARCLRYLYKSRPDICLVKGLVSRLKENIRKSHMNNVARRILRYIAGTLEFGFFLPKSARNAKPEIEIGWLSDVDWCGDKVDRRSTRGYVFKFQSAPVSWCSKKQSVIALSSCEAEYVAGSLAACQANWLQSFLCEERSVPEAKKGDRNCQL